MSYAAAADGGPIAAERRATYRYRGKRQQASGQQQSAASGAATSAANQPASQAAASPSAAASQGSQAQSQAQAATTQQQGSGNAAASGQQPTAVESSSFTVPSYSTDPGAFISSSVSESAPKGLSTTAIGALVGGIIGGIALIIIAFVIWRQCRGRGEKVAPPPPREVSYRPPTTLVGSRSRSMSMTMSTNRASSYSTLIAPPTSYRQSLYGAYPGDSPTSSIQDQSPRFISSSISGSPSLSSSGGNTTPATGPTRDGSTGSNSDSKDEMSTAFREHDGRPLNRGPSSDQLSPYEGVTSTDGSDSRTTGSDSRTSSPPPSIAGRLPPRNTSMGSLGSSGLRYPAHSVHRQRSGAPHHRSISITLPRPLSESSVNDSNPVSPSGTMTFVHRGSHYSSNRTTPRTSMHAEFGGQSTHASPSGHRRGPSTSSRTSGHRPDTADVDNLRFEGREEIV